MATEFAYMDTMEEAGLVIEFIRMTLLGRAISPAPGLIHLVGRLQKLSGRRSISI
jgi:hypothetical protein